MADVHVGRTLVIPDAELKVRFTTSGGPGGQHANKASTRVELMWNVDGSAVLNARQRQALRSSLRHRLDAEGVLHVVSDETRSQHRNRAAAERRLAHLVAQALRPTKERRATKPTRSSQEKRLTEKKQRGEVKRARQSPQW